jgi:hypothetical protein
VITGPSLKRERLPGGEKGAKRRGEKKGKRRGKGKRGGEGKGGEGNAHSEKSDLLPRQRILKKSLHSKFIDYLIALLRLKGGLHSELFMQITIQIKPQNLKLYTITTNIDRKCFSLLRYKLNINAVQTDRI